MWLLDETNRLAHDLRGVLEREVLPLSSLQDVVRWAFAQTPPRDVAAVVVQDEYCHDVVVPWRDGLVLVFDTT
ncbi:MAG: hypothetical protein SFW67_10280 [Myxococcaceae bacterium]|nr:hypothetical protein [Myxococcaceae bacterium]